MLRVQPGGPAEVAGIRPTVRGSDGRLRIGDLVVAIDDEPVDSSDDLLNVLERRGVGQAVEVTVWRERREVTVRVTLQ